MRYSTHIHIKRTQTIVYTLANKHTHTPHRLDILVCAHNYVYTHINTCTHKHCHNTHTHTHTLTHTYSTLTHRDMRFQLSFSHKYFLQPGDEETTGKASTLNEMDRKQYETMFADILITYELLEFGESIGEGRHRTTRSNIMLQFMS